MRSIQGARQYRGCDALIVDTRHNGGGWLHNDLAVFLNARLYTERRPRGVEMSPEPYDKWIKPLACWFVKIIIPMPAAFLFV